MPTFLASIIGVFSLCYALPHVPHHVLSNFVTRRLALSAHAISAAVTLLAGPWQLLPWLRRGHIAVQRILGLVYVAAVFIGWIASVPVGLHADTGPLASAGFLARDVCWMITTTRANLHARRRDIAKHRRWMIRSDALTAAAITLRIRVGTVLVARASFASAYTAIAWLCWAPNLAVVEFASRRAGNLGRRPRRHG